MSRGVVLELAYSVKIRWYYRGHLYILKNVLMLGSISVLFGTLELFRLLGESPAPAINRHGNCCM